MLNQINVYSVNAIQVINNDVLLCLNILVRTCPALPKIANGFKFFVPGRVRDEFPNTDESCLNLPDTSCHYQCNHGYRLDSHPGLICLTNGTWSGKVPQCKGRC